MTLIVIGALLIVAGVVLGTVRTVKSGRMSEAEEPVSHAPRDTLEPTGQGRRLSFKADLPGLALILLGAIILFVGAA